MKHTLFRIKSLLIIFIILISVVPHAVLADSANVYYVATDGSDSASGSRTSPFATLSHAAKVMQAGDTCYIREGVYYETLDTNLNGTKENKILFKAYNGENVTLSGGTLLNNFKQYDGNIYSADMDWDIYSGNGNMVFADGEICLEARWPNATVNDLLDRSTYAKVAYANDLTITDYNLPNVNLKNAQMWIANGPSYWSTLVNITSHNSILKTLMVEDVFSTVSYRPKKGNLYYITRSYDLLDSPGEWYKDIEAKKLYFYAPDGVNPNDLNIEARKREYVINLTESSYVEFYGINVRGGIVAFSGTTNNCRFSDAVIEAVDYKMASGSQPGAKGVVLEGTYNKISNCEIKNMFGEGVSLGGKNNYVVNNYIHDMNFEHTYSDGVYITGENHLISRNTITKTGRSTLGGKFDSCVISYNDLSDSCRISQDGGTVYFNSHDFKNSEIHHNIIHDAMNNEGLHYGFYLDSMTTSMIVYNNLVYGMETETSDKSRLTLCLNPNSMNTLFINNTFVNTRPANTYGGSLYDLSGCVFINNLFRSKAHSLSEEELESMDVIFKNNLYGSEREPADFWNDSANCDFTLSDESSAIDAGVHISGITDSFIGDAPDVGAFEYGEEKWTAGHDFSKKYELEFKLNNDIPFRNILSNGGFESGLSEWSGSSDLYNSSSWTFWGKFAKEGSYSLKMSGGDVLSRTISGLKPFTTYKVGGYGFIGGDFTKGNTFTQAYDKNYNTTTLTAALPQNRLDNIGALSYNYYFGDKEFDTLNFGIRFYKKGQKITLRNGSIDAEPLAIINETEDYSSIGWKWYKLRLSEPLSGNGVIYVCLDSGDFSETAIGGFYPGSTFAEESIVVNVAGDVGYEKQLIFDSENYEQPMPSVYIVTGPDGKIDLNISKNGDLLYGYVDYINISENSEEIMNFAENIFTIGNAVRDENGILRDNKCFKPGEFNMFELSYVNTTDENVSFEGIMLSYDANETLASVSSIEYSIQAKNKSNIVLGKQIGENIGKVKILTWESFESLNPLTDINTFYTAFED